MGFMDMIFNSNSGMKPDGKKSNLERYQPFNEEFSLDMTSEPYGNDMNSANNSYSGHGVELQDARNTLRLVYSGILAKNGAEEIEAVVGYGNNLHWEDVNNYPMHNLNNGKFELMLPVIRAGNINIAFKDSQGNWDNNSGMNYSFTNLIYEGSH